MVQQPSLTPLAQEPRTTLPTPEAARHLHRAEQTSAAKRVFGYIEGGRYHTGLIRLDV